MASFCLSCVGFLFDFFQAAVNVSDITTDVLVTIEFYQEGRTVFFGLVLSSLILSSFINAITFALRLEAWFPTGRRPSEWYHWAGVVFLLLPIAQLLPVINYIACMCSPAFRDEIAVEKVHWNIGVDGEVKPEGKNHSHHSKTVTGEEEQEDVMDVVPARKVSITEPVSSNNDNNNKDESAKSGNKLKEGNTGAASAQMFSESVAPQHKKLGLLDDAVTSRVGSFLLFNVSAICESVPNSVIQLVAISLAKEATTLQIISLCLSLFSVACKAFQLCRSFTTTAFFAKLFFLSHDLFKLAFVMSALLSASAPQNVAVFGSELYVTELSYAWIIMKCLVIVVSLLTGLVVMIKITTEAEDCEDGCLRPMAMLMMFVLGVGPAAIVQEAVFFAVLIAANVGKQPSTVQMPFATLLHEFLWGGSESTEVRELTDWKKTFEKLVKFADDLWTKPRNPNGDDGDGANDDEQQELNNQEENSDESGLPLRHHNYRRGVQKLTERQKRQRMHVAIQAASRLPNSRSVRFRQMQQPMISQRISKPDGIFSRLRHVMLMSSFLQQADMVPFARPTFDTWTDDLRNSFEMLKARVAAFVEGPGKRLLDPEIFPRDLTYPDLIPSYQTVKNEMTCATFCRHICDGWEPLAAFVIVTSWAIGAIMGFVFPLLYAILYFKSFTIMMSICWYAWAFSLLMSVLLSREFYKYHISCEVFVEHCPAANVHIIVDAFFTCPLSVLSVAAVPNSTIPTDALESHVLPFLDPRAIGLYGIASEDFRMVQELFDSIPVAANSDETAKLFGIKIGGDNDANVSHNDNNNEEKKERDGENEIQLVHVNPLSSACEPDYQQDCPGTVAVVVDTNKIVLT